MINDEGKSISAFFTVKILTEIKNISYFYSVNIFKCSNCCSLEK